MTQRNKNIFITVGFLIMVILAFKYAISNTLELRSEYKSLKTDAVVFDNLPSQLSSLKQKESYLDSLLLGYQLNENSMQNNVLKAISSYSTDKSIKVLDFLEPHVTMHEGVVINIYQFTLEGDYLSIINLIHQFEQKTKFGEIIHLGFYKVKNHKTGRYYLQADVLLKSFG